MTDETDTLFSRNRVHELHSLVLITPGDQERAVFAEADKPDQIFRAKEGPNLCARASAPEPDRPRHGLALDRLRGQHLAVWGEAGKTGTAIDDKQWRRARPRPERPQASKREQQCQEHAAALRPALHGSIVYRRGSATYRKSQEPCARRQCPN